ncbi:MAG: virginiamycin B lyase family protein [Gemmatimonadales bacterium]
MRPITLTALLVLGAAGGLAAQDAAFPIREWNVPWGREGRPRDPSVMPDGKIMFVGQTGNYLARLDPATGEFKRYEIDAGTNPHNVIVDDKGMAWYAGNRNGMIGKLDPATGAITRYPMPDSTARDPHTLVFDGRGNIWFTVQQSNKVGRLNMASGKIDLIPTGERTRPYGIVVDKSGRPWFDLFATNKIGTVDPATLELREYPLPNAESRPRRIAMTSDGAVWYVDYRRGYLGRLDTKTGAVKEWPNPSGAQSLPYAMSVDDRDRLWFVETGVQPNRFVGFDSKTERFFANTPVPGGGGTVRHMVFDPKTRVIWFGSDNGTIGRAEVGVATAATP